MDVRLGNKAMSAAGSGASLLRIQLDEDKDSKENRTHKDVTIPCFLIAMNTKQQRVIVETEQVNWSWRDCCMTLKVLLVVGLMVGARWLYMTYMT